MPVTSLKDLRQGGKYAMAEALAEAEHSAGDETICKLLDEAYCDPVAQVLGLTGPPGVGKSSLINALIKHWRENDVSVGVIAVDPSSHVTGGALLGDRTRMTTDPDDQGAFVRSLATRGRLGGLSEFTYAAVVLMRAVYDKVIVESVGVGQSEADISSVADTIVLCVQPGSGDSLQFMKAGIMEIPHIAVVTKADFGAPARRALADLEGGLSLSVAEESDWLAIVLAVSSATGEGLENFNAAFDAHWEWLRHNHKLESLRKDQAIRWLTLAIRSRFGSVGLEKVEDGIARKVEDGPFRREMEIVNSFRVFVQNDKTEKNL